MNIIQTCTRIKMTEVIKTHLHLRELKESIKVYVAIKHVHFSAALVITGHHLHEDTENRRDGFSKNIDHLCEELH